MVSCVLLEWKGCESVVGVTLRDASTPCPTKGGHPEASLCLYVGVITINLIYIHSLWPAPFKCWTLTSASEHLGRTFTFFLLFIPQTFIENQLYPRTSLSFVTYATCPFILQDPPCANGPQAFKLQDAIKQTGFHFQDQESESQVPYLIAN